MQFFADRAGKLRAGWVYQVVRERIIEEVASSEPIGADKSG